MAADRSALCVLCPARPDRPAREADVGNTCSACAARLGNVLREIADLDALLVDQELPRDQRRAPVIERVRDKDGRLVRDEAGRVVTRPVLDADGHPATRLADPVAGALPAGPTAAAADGARISGTAEARPPLPVDVLNIRGDGTVHVTEPLIPLVRTWRDPDPDQRVPTTFAGQVVRVGVWHRATVLDPAGRPVLVPLGDQVGELPPRMLLEQWVIEWRAQRGFRPTGDEVSGHQVADYTAWLLARLDWALHAHPALPDFAGEMRALAGWMRAAAGAEDPHPVRKPASIPCRNDRCDARGTLYQVPGEDWVECGACGLILREHEYEEWVARLAAFERSRNRRRAS